MVVYGSFIVLGGMSNLVISKIDLLMIPAWLSAADLGVYTLSFFIGTIIEVPRKAIGQISTPLIAQAWASNDLGQLSKMYKSSARNQFVIGLFIFLLIWLNVREIFALIPNGERFIAGQYVILFIGLTRLIDMLTGLNQEILLQSSAYRFNFWMLLVLALLNILFNAWLIPALGISGAALGTLLAYLLYNLAKGWFLYRQFGLQPFTWPIIPTAGLGGLVYGVGLFFPMTGWAALDIFLRSSLIALLFGAGVWVWQLSPELVAMAQNLRKKP
ncbi:MAG: hypothetical protein HC913_23515 [Microscillaceae bacterium]|nr:hypothetical protein [Microscillaceae bacterium]